MKSSKMPIRYLWLQPTAAPGVETTAAAAVSPVTKADVKPQVQPTAPQQATPLSAVSTASQLQTPSSPSAPQRPARRKQASQGQQPAAQPSPSRPATSQPAAPVQQQVAQPSAVQAQSASGEVSQKAAETVSVPPLGIKTVTITVDMCFVNKLIDLSMSCFQFSLRNYVRKLKKQNVSFLCKV